MMRRVPKGRWSSVVLDRFLGWLASYGVEVHEGQRWLLQRRYKEKYVVAGRRYGKSEYLALEILAHIMELRMVGMAPMVRLVAPRHDQIGATVKALERLAGRLRLGWDDKTRDTTNPHVVFDGVEILLRVANNQEAHRSGNATLLCIDEVRDVDEDVFHEAMRPMLIDYDGCIVFATSARGWSWFVHRAAGKGIRVKEEGFMWGEDAIYWDEVPAEVAWLQAPSWMNPFIPRDDIRAMWDDEFNRSPAVARQELGAAILKEYGHPFPNLPLLERVDTSLPEWRFGKWVIGADYGASAALAGIWVVKGLNGLYYVDREVYQDNTSDSRQQMQLFKEKGVTPEMVIVADKSIWNRDVRGAIVNHWRETGKQVFGFQPTIVPATGVSEWYDRRKEGDTGRTDPSRKPAGLRAHMLGLLRDLFADKKVIINPDGCPNLIREITMAESEPHKYLDIKKPDHAIMALAYALDYLEPIAMPKITRWDDVGYMQWFHEKYLKEDKPRERDDETDAGGLFDWVDTDMDRSRDIPYREAEGEWLWID